MECCGKAFSIGDTVKWLVCKTEQINTPVDTGEINYCYEAHSSDWQNIFVLEGKVETECAKGFDKKFHDMEASGYIVSLNEYAIRPAKKNDVTFK